MADKAFAKIVDVTPKRVPTLADLEVAHIAAHVDFEMALSEAFPGQTEWHWLRAVDHIAGFNCRRNDDTSLDVAMAAHVGIRAVWDSYITKLHQFYALRDGPRGVLGGRGL